MDVQTHSCIPDRLAGVTPDDDNIFDICQQTGLKWEAACALLSWFELPSILFTIMVGVAIIVANIQFLGETCKNLIYVMQKN